MRIAIDVRPLMNPQYSGVGWFSFNLLTALFELDRQNDYVLFYNSSRPVSMPEFGYPNVRYQPLGWSNKLLNASLLVFGRPRLDLLLADRPDIFFAPNLNFLASSGGAASVIVAHDLSFLAFPEFFTLKQRLWHWLAMARRPFAKADMVIAVSESTKRDLACLLKLPPEKIRVVYEGAPPAFLPSASGQADALDLPEKYFLFIGANEPRKNLRGVCQAIRQLPEQYKLVVAGPKGWKVPAEILSDPAIASRVVRLDYLAEKYKPEAYRRAVALVYPSFYEGFGLPLVEAMSAGCPVIAGNNSSQGEVVGDAGLLADPFDIAAISRAMRLLTEDEGLRRKLISRGLKQAEAFSWQKAARSILSIFQELYENRH